MLEGEFGLLPLETKHASLMDRRTLRALRDFVSERGCCFGQVVDNGSVPRQHEEQIVSVPFCRW